MSIQPKEPEQKPVAYIKAAELNELKHCNGMSLWAENAAIHTDDSISKQLLPSGHVPVYTTPPQRKPLKPVEGDLLPAIGSKVLIHLARQDEWVEHTVVGYYVLGSLDGRDERTHRVFVRVVDADGIQNAQMLRDVRPVEAAHGIKGD